MKYKKRTVFLVFYGILFFFSLSGWADLSFGEAKVAVAPFQVQPSPGEETVRCASCGNLIPAGRILGDPSSILTHMLWDLIRSKAEGFEWISPGEVEGAYNVYLAKKIQPNIPRMMEDIGKQLGADYILWGTVFRYEERIGTAYAVQQPASVAFDLHLLRLKDGVMVWRAPYAKTQKSLSENLFNLKSFVKEKMRWVTVEELSRLGLEQLLKDFPSAESLKK